MATDAPRQITEDEFFLVEDAYVECRDHGKTEKSCPWCGGDLKFIDRVSAHSIECSRCDLKVTVRGI